MTWTMLVLVIVLVLDCEHEQGSELPREALEVMVF
jgi:hypothetical protein